MEEYCVCGHSKNIHNGWEGEPTGCDSFAIGSEYFEERYLDCHCSEFKLDNLRFVEDEAKRRNLIN